jgi:hypothetical protein
VLATVPVSDRFYYSGSKKAGFLSNGSLNQVHKYSSENLVFGISNMQLCMAHLFMVSDCRYLQTQQAALKLLSFLTQKRGFWAAAC